MKPEISVIIPAHNAEQWVEEQLRAVTSQTSTLPFEVLVVDNGSNDRTRELVRRFVDQDHRVRLVIADRIKGSAHARNQGAKAARGRVLLFCDADDRVDSGWLSALSGAVRPNVLATGPLIVDSINPGPVARTRPPRATDGLARPGGFLPFAPTGNLGVERELFLRCGGLAEHYLRSHDVEFSWRAQLRFGVSLRFEPSARVHYRYRSSVTGRFKQAFRSGRATAQLYSDFRSDGLPGRDARGSVTDLWWLISRLPLMIGRRHRAPWLRRAGEAAGRLVGSIRYRVWFM